MDLSRFTKRENVSVLIAQSGQVKLAKNSDGKYFCENTFFVSLCQPFKFF
jgi:hypothetical protein